MNLHKKIDSLSDIVKNINSYEDIILKLLEEIEASIEANIILFDEKNSILYKSEYNNYIQLENEFRNYIFESFLMNNNEILENISCEKLFLKSSNYFKNCCFSIFPIFIMKKKVGNVLAIKKDNNIFNSDEIILIKTFIIMISIIIIQIKNKEAEEIERQHSIVRAAMGTLSFSELEAAINVFNVLDGKEGLLVASKIADEAKITRSVIVNALRKLESAGIIESRSLGMKGTYIKIINKNLIEELGKLKVNSMKKI